MYRHVYNKGVTGGTEGDILGKLPRKRANLVNPTVVDFCNVHTQPCIHPAKNGLGQRAKIRCYSKPDTRRGRGSSKSWQLVVKPDP